MKAIGSGLRFGNSPFEDQMSWGQPDMKLRLTMDDEIQVDPSFVFNHLDVYFQSRPAILQFSFREARCAVISKCETG
jgi:hypothetical protein